MKLSVYGFKNDKYSGGACKKSLIKTSIFLKIIGSMLFSFIVRAAKKYPSGTKNRTANRKLEISAAKNFDFRSFSKKFCIFDVEIASKAAIIIPSKNGA
jgi:hypothetical protein